VKVTFPLRALTTAQPEPLTYASASHSFYHASPACRSTKLHRGSHITLIPPPSNISTSDAPSIQSCADLFFFSRQKTPKPSTFHSANRYAEIPKYISWTETAGLLNICCLPATHHSRPLQRHRLPSQWLPVVHLTLAGSTTALHNSSWCCLVRIIRYDGVCRDRMLTVHDRRVCCRQELHSTAVRQGSYYHCLPGV
jgi:hypothetical protein